MFSLVTVVAILSTAFSVSAARNYSIPVHVPDNAAMRIENGQTVYCNFYDSTSGYTYGFYNPTDGSYYRYRERVATMDEVPRAMAMASSDKVVVHDYEFATTTSVNGWWNGITFVMPSTSGWIEGYSSIISNGVR